MHGERSLVMSMGIAKRADVESPLQRHVVDICVSQGRIHHHCGLDP